METPIITEYGHQYVYSDVLHYFLYVPEKMKIAMRGSGHNVVGATDYYMRKFNFLREYHFLIRRKLLFKLIVQKIWSNKIWLAYGNC